MTRSAQVSRVTPLHGIALLKPILASQWSADTSYHASGGWTPTNPSYGQCAITALKIQDLLGGELVRVSAPYGGTHYANLINGEIHDLEPPRDFRRARWLSQAAMA
jgi:hypothetical protein